MLDLLEHEDMESPQSTIKICKNGDPTPVMILPFEKFQDVGPFKKYMLKKLRMSEENYTNFRVFSVFGQEFCNYDSITPFKQLDTLFYSFGEDFNYKPRFDALQYRKDLGEGGFGTVQLMYDQLT
jgi:hypothetical protein